MTKFKSLNEKLIGIIEDYGLVTFVPVSVKVYSDLHCRFAGSYLVLNQN